MNNWYILRTYAKKEHKVKEQLEKIIQRDNLHNVFEDIQIPTESVITVSGKNKKVRERVLYSGYVFVKTTLSKAVTDVVSELKDTTGFLTLSRTDRTPVRLQPHEVRTMLKYQEDRSKDPTPVLDLKVGDYVQITSGPLKGYQGSISDIYQEKLRATIQLSIFGRITPTDVDLSDIEILK